MITFEKAVTVVEAITPSLKTERVELLQALNRVLAEDIHTDMDIPPFDKSAMDGFACRKADLENMLEVIEELPAGRVPKKHIGPDQCARIMTGGMVPGGADFVLQLEHIEEVKPGFIRRVKESLHANICFAGEDVRKGECVLGKGVVIIPQHIAILASAGITRPLVFSVPTLAVISTGDELVEPSENPGMSKIRNSNAWQLMAQASATGYTPDYLGIVPDEEKALTDILTRATGMYDLVLISGGVSVGDYDFVPKVLNHLGAEIIIHGLDAKPGRHLLFARVRNTLVFGLPGNPVSSFVQFELLIKPLLLTLKGMVVKPEVRQLSIEDDYLRRKPDTLSFIPGCTGGGGTVTPLEYHGSAHIHAYRKADCIIEIPKGVSLIKKGDLVNVRSI